MTRRSMFAAAALAILALLAGDLTAQGRGKGGGGPPPQGTVYFFSYWPAGGWGMWSMAADGSGEPTPLLAIDGGDPSRRLYGDLRWFLQRREIAGQTYPSGRTRVELYAVREGGASVQLTTQPDLELVAWDSAGEHVMRWSWDDGWVSWIARRWSGGQVVDGGIYTAAVLFVGGDVTGLAFQPTAPAVPATLVPDGSHLAPDMGVHDVSPDGTRMVYATAAGLRWTDVVTGESLLLTNDGAAPAWSPDGATIAFHTGDAIRTIDVDGSNPNTLVRAWRERGFSGWVSKPVYSPDGNHLAFTYISNYSLRSEIYRVTAAGKQKAHLTGDNTLGSSVAVGWR